MGGIFISYRNGTHSVAVGALADRLRHYFGRGQVFCDTQMTPGTRYPDELRARLLDSNALVAVIHDGWTDEFDRPRDTDWVRYEIATALEKRIPVVPVLLEQADPPRRDQLPEDIAELTVRQAARLRGAEFPADVGDLVRLLERHIEPTTEPPPPRTVPRPRRVGRRIAAWATGLFLLTLILVSDDPAEDQQVWEWFGYAAFISTMALAGSSILVSALIPIKRWTYRMDINWQTMPTREFVHRTWILPALGVLPIAYGMVKTWPGKDRRLHEWEVWAVVALGIIALYFLHRTMRHHGTRQNAWPPLVTTESIMFRRAAHRLHHKLTTEPDWRGARSRAIQRKAVSIYLDLAEVRMELKTRAGVSLRRWIGTGYSGWVTAWLGWLMSILALDGFALGLVLRQDSVPAGPFRLIAVTVLAAVIFTAVMVVAHFYGDRWEVRRWIGELTEWQAKLGPLIFRPPSGDPDE
ncbi:MAG TPA: toll/interleukin-1 receptor domain-containing protein [Actinophytocola sp.]|uniref:toll/interleukin-1 receptor domain-containing protein n=1 Tax=Actinophytocola sp. TaxID=1872138 RepID=UPI002DB90738|nr:toll/interleukin-1 receptor domain-containing protein [Actinophytocola sp.]HEU5474848.1 toll/interleukin-1 receptor domain-containing protein [Actinophytocola sp.]